METKQVAFSDGRQLCALGQGTWNMGRNPLTKKEETTALLTGIELGMTMVDTAEMYNTKSLLEKL